MDQAVTSWWSMTSAYFTAAAALLSGDVQLTTLLPACGLVFAAIGIVLAFRWREKRAVWLIPPVVLTLLAPLIVTLGETMMGPFGIFFTLIAGFVGLLLWIAIVANDAGKRLPVWLIGLGCLSFVGFFARIAVAQTWGL
jgi:hypothetical protein